MNEGDTISISIMILLVITITLVEFKTEMSRLHVYPLFRTLSILVSKIGVVLSRGMLRIAFGVIKS